MKVKISENILHLDITNQTKKLKKGDIFYVPKIYNLYLVNDMSIDKDKDKVNVKTGQLSDEEKCLSFQQLILVVLHLELNMVQFFQQKV